MSQATIPADVRRFIQQCIPSVPFLEAILLIRENPGSGWDPKQLAQRLYLGEAVATELLQQLHVAGMVSPAGPDGTSYRYAPGSAQLQLALERLAQVYVNHLVEVSKLIHLKSHRKAHLFADAFIWRKDR
jgi:hypothetical protein